MSLSFWTLNCKVISWLSSEFEGKRLLYKICKYFNGNVRLLPDWVRFETLATIVNFMTRGTRISSIYIPKSSVLNEQIRWIKVWMFSRERDQLGLQTSMKTKSSSADAITHKSQDWGTAWKYPCVYVDCSTCVYYSSQVWIWTSGAALRYHTNKLNTSVAW